MLTVVCSTELTQKQTEKNEIYPNKAKLYWSQSIAILSTRSFWRFPLIMVNLIVKLDAFISASSSKKTNHFHFYSFAELVEYSVCRVFVSSLCVLWCNWCACVSAVAFLFLIRISTLSTKAAILTDRLTGIPNNIALFYCFWQESSAIYVLLFFLHMSA